MGSKNQETVKIGDKEYPLSEVFFDHYLDKHVTKESKPVLIQGVVDIDDNGALVTGYFSPAMTNTTMYGVDGMSHIVISSHIFNKPKTKHLFIEGADGAFRSKPNTNFVSHLQLLEVSESYKKSLPYSIGSNEISKIQNYLKFLDIKPSKEAASLHKLLNGLSVGVELETSEGVIPMNVLAETGLQPLRDGSIGGVEYVTIPLSTEKDCQLLINATNAIQNYTKNNGTCALHFHFGNIPRDVTFLTILWQVVAVIQNDLYSMQPPYKMLNWGVKRKSYSKPLPQSVTGKITQHESIDSNFGYIYEYLSMGQSFNSVNNDLNNVKSHPSDPSGNHKWNINTRYHILNLIPIIFGNKATVEFRISEITSNSTMILNELIVFSTIVNYVKHNYKELAKNIKRNNLISLGHVIQHAVTSMGVSGYYGSIATYIQEKESIVSSHYKQGKIHLASNVNCYPILGDYPKTVTSVETDREKLVEYILKNPKMYTLKRLKSEEKTTWIPQAFGVDGNTPRMMGINFLGSSELLHFSENGRYSINNTQVNIDSTRIDVQVEAFNLLKIAILGMPHRHGSNQRALMRTIMQTSPSGDRSNLSAISPGLFTELVATCLGNKSQLGKALRRSFLRLREHVRVNVGETNVHHLKIENDDLVIFTNRDGVESRVLNLSGIISYRMINEEIMMIVLDTLEQQINTDDSIMSITPSSLNGAFTLVNTTITAGMQNTSLIRRFLRFMNAVKVVLHDLGVDNPTHVEETIKPLLLQDGFSEDGISQRITRNIELQRLINVVTSNIQGYDQVFTLNSLVGHGQD